MMISSSHRQVEKQQRQDRETVRELRLSAERMYAKAGRATGLGDFIHAFHAAIDCEQAAAEISDTGKEEQPENNNPRLEPHADV